METASLFRTRLDPSGVMSYVSQTFVNVMESRCRAAALARESGLSETDIVGFVRRFAKDPGSIPAFDFSDCRRLNKAIMAVSGRRTLGRVTPRIPTKTEHADDKRIRDAEMYIYRERGRDWDGR